MTIINVATPREIPKKEKIVIIEKNFSLVLGNKYFAETQISKTKHFLFFQVKYCIIHQVLLIVPHLFF